MADKNEKSSKKDLQMRKERKLLISVLAIGSIILGWEVFIAQIGALFELTVIVSLGIIYMILADKLERNENNL